MSTIHDILDALSDNDRNVLRFALQNEIAHHVVYAPNRFIGVHVNNPNFKKEMAVGAWSIGTLNDDKNQS